MPLKLPTPVSKPSVHKTEGLYFDYQLKYLYYVQMPRASATPVDKRYPELFRHDPCLSEIQLLRIYDQLPDGIPLIQGSLRRETEILGLTLWVGYSDRLGPEVYSISRPISSTKVLWHIHWTRWTGHKPVLITDDYTAYLHDLTILRLLT